MQPISVAQHENAKAFLTFWLEDVNPDAVDLNHFTDRQGRMCGGAHLAKAGLFGVTHDEGNFMPRLKLEDSLLTGHNVSQYLFGDKGLFGPSIEFGGIKHYDEFLQRLENLVSRSVDKSLPDYPDMSTDYSEDFIQIEIHGSRRLRGIQYAYHMDRATDPDLRINPYIPIYFNQHVQADGNPSNTRFAHREDMKEILAKATKELERLILQSVHNSVVGPNSEYQYPGKAPSSVWPPPSVAVRRHPFSVFTMCPA